MNNWSGELQGIIVTFCFNQFPSGVGESALKGGEKKAVQKKGRDRESGCWWKWTWCLQSLRWHLLQLKTSFIQTRNDFFSPPLFSPSEAFCQSDTERPFYLFLPNRAACCGHDFPFSETPICWKFHRSWRVFQRSLNFQLIDQSKWNKSKKTWFVCPQTKNVAAFLLHSCVKCRTSAFVFGNFSPLLSTGERCDLCG